MTPRAADGPPVGTMADSEWAQRMHLAAAYRLAAKRGWDDLVWTHISAAVPGETNAYLLNRFGLQFHEITASNLVKVNVAGQVIDGSNAPINPSGFAIHGCVHAARPDAVCVLHLHTFWAQAFAATGDDLLPCSQPAMRFFQRLGRHAYEGLAFAPDEQARLVQSLERRDGLILENHGVLLVGRTVAEAFVLMHLFERAARLQLTAKASGSPLVCAPEHVARRTYQQWVGPQASPDGVDEWPALLRSLERSDSDYRH